MAWQIMKKYEKEMIGQANKEMGKTLLYKVAWHAPTKKRGSERHENSLIELYFHCFGAQAPPKNFNSA